MPRPRSRVRHNSRDVPTHYAPRTPARRDTAIGRPTTWPLQQRCQGAGATDGAAHRGAQIDARSTSGGSCATRGQFRKRESEARDHRAYRRQLLGGHRLEIAVLQHFARREGERGVDAHLVRLLARSALQRRLEQRLCDARRQFRLRLTGPDGLRQQRRHHLVEHARIAPEHIERCIEHGQAETTATRGGVGGRRGL